MDKITKICVQKGEEEVKIQNFALTSLMNRSLVQINVKNTQIDKKYEVEK